MEKRQLLYKNSVVSYYHFGTGPKAVLCFHGYGEEAEAYAFLDKYLGNQYVFYAFDLPFHGQTDWKEELEFSPADLQEISQQVLSADNPQLEASSSKLTLMGFSLGGRVALSLYQLQPEKFEKLVLLAPDGLQMNPWYWLATQTWLGNRFFAFTMHYPAWFFGLLKVFNKLGFVNSSVFKFVSYYIGNKDARHLLYARWTVFRKLKPDRAGIKSFCRRYATKFRLVYGKHDRIILPVRGENFIKGIEEHCTLTIIASGHQVLHEKHVAEIMAALKQ